MMFKFNLTYVALAAALSSSFVYADPNTWTHSSGTTVVDIEKPNAAGVSHNMYRDFNVGSNGMILNNSGDDLTHDKFGNIARNNNLTNGSASVILNEVTSNKSSSLNGFIEVAGQKADVIIANPNGISCSGCSFINTNSAVLTTGQVKLNDNGGIGSYTVSKGKITIGKNGMDATNNYALLLAETIAINGTLSAANATLGAGSFTFDNTTQKMTSAGKTPSVMQMLFPEYSIDISNLGGIKANSISMMGNDYGLGVRNKGSIVSNSMLSMVSSGELVNEGSITGNGMLTQIVSAGNFNNSGSISTTSATAINSLQALTNNGTITGTRQLVVNASGNLENNGTISNKTALSVTTNGNLKTSYGSNLLSDNQLVVGALGNIDNGGSTRAKNTTVSFSGSSLNVTGNIHGTETLTIQSIKDKEISSGAIGSSGTIKGGNIAIKTKGNVILNKGSQLLVTDNLTAESKSFNNKGGTIRGDNAVMNFTHSGIQNSGEIIGGTINISTKSDFLNEWLIQSFGDMTIDTNNNGNIINRGLIHADGTMTLNAKKIVNGGYKCGFLGLMTCEKGTLSGNKLVVNAYHNYASEIGGSQYFKSTEINTLK